MICSCFGHILVLWSCVANSLNFHEYPLFEVTGLLDWRMEGEGGCEGGGREGKKGE